MAEEAEVLAEVDAVRAVYGDDCRVVREFPPHLAVHMRPRTADVSSQQFVEAVVEIEAGTQYPESVPFIKVIDSKGLDEKRQEHLMSCIRAKAQELSSCLMLVALCEESVDILSNMNHPAGDCPLCLDPLFPEDKDDDVMPFMKLMSCFHCFHSECIVRWWRWLQEENIANSSSHHVSSSTLQIRGGVDSSASLTLANCPVCRQKFDSRDIEHVLILLETNSIMTPDGDMLEDVKEFLQSHEEKRRREKFESLLELQRAKGGLVEQQKIKAIMPGMFLPESVSLPSRATICDPIEDAAANVTFSEMPSEVSSIKSSISAHKRSDPRRNRNHRHYNHHHQNHHRRERNPDSGCKWVQKENNASHQ